MNETELERLVVRLNGDATGYQKMARDATRATRSMVDEIEVSDNRIGLMSQRVNAFGMQIRGYGAQMAAVGAALIGIGSTSSSIFRGVQLAADAELMKSSFETMLGSAEAATRMVKSLQEFAAKTPLNTSDLQRFSKMLLQAGVEAGDLIPTIKMLGDAALGDAQKIHGLAYAFGQVKTFGRLMGGELIQLRNAGFDPLAEISRTTGKNMGTLRQEMEQGKISFETVKNAFKTATAEGGRFANGMEKASTTLSGLYSTMQDDIDAFLRTLGEQVVEQLSLKQVMKEVSSAAQALTEWFKQLSPETMKFFAALAAGVAGAAGAIAFLLALKVMVGAVIGLVGLLGPWGIALVAAFATASAVVATLVGKIGGIGKALEYLKAQGQAAWEWLAPVRDAVSSLVDTVGNLLTQAWDAVWTAAVRAVEAMGLDINWERVREVATNAIYQIEFTLLNFGRVSEMVWLRIQYDAVRVANNIVHFHTDVIPAAIRHANGLIISTFLDLWAKMKRAPVDFAVWFIDFNIDMFKTVMSTWVDFIKWQAKVITELPSLIAQGAEAVYEFFKPGGAGSPTRLGREVGAAFRESRSEVMKEAEATGKAASDAMSKGFTIPQRGEGVLEKQLREEWERARDALGQDLQTFTLNRKVRDAFRRAFGGGTGIGADNPAATSINEITDSAQKATKAVASLNSVLVGSSEDRKLLREYTAAVGMSGRSTATPPGNGNRDLLQRISDATTNMSQRMIAIADAAF